MTYFSLMGFLYASMVLQDAKCHGSLFSNYFA